MGTFRLGVGMLNVGSVGWELSFIFGDRVRC